MSEIGTKELKKLLDQMQLKNVQQYLDRNTIDIQSIDKKASSDISSLVYPDCWFWTCLRK